VRIEHLAVEGFGRLASWDSGPEALGPLVVLLGPNEAGKSTLFSFLTTALYGFQPASRESNPHVPWGSDEAGGEIRIRLADGRYAHVARRLRSTPSGKLSIGEATRELRNQPVPWVEHVPRTVFRQVFAITLAELAGLDEGTWAHIQDRVLGSMGATDLRPPRAVADALEKEAGEIWRPNRRGNQRLRDVHDAIRALRARRLDALERDRTIRALVDEREDVRHRLRELREQRERDQIVLQRAQELLPVRRQLERIQALRLDGGAIEELDELPADPPAALRGLNETRTRLEEGLRELEQAEVEPKAAMRRFDEVARRVVDHRDVISSLVAQAPTADAMQTESASLAAELRELDAQLRTAAEPLMTAPWSDALAGPLRRLSLDLLRDRIERADARREWELERVGRSPEGPGGAVVRVDRWPGAFAVTGLVAAGLALLAWSGLGGPAPTGPLGGALLAGILTLFVLSRRPRNTPAAPEGTERSLLDELDREIRDLLAELPLRDGYLEPPSASLVGALEHLRSVVVRRAEVGRRIEDLHRHLDAFGKEASRVAEALGAIGVGSPSAFARRVEGLLRDAERASNAAEAAAGEVRRLDRSRVRLESELAEAVTRESELQRRLAGAAGPNATDAAVEIHRRLEAHTRADRLEDELARSHPDLDELRARIVEAEAEGAAWMVGDTEVATRRTRVDEAGEAIERLVAGAKELEVKVAHLRDLETVDAVDGEVVSLREEEQRLVEERDRKWLLGQLLREADRRFREEHQPDLLRKASRNLSGLTSGRYDRLLVDEHGEGDLFQVMGPDLPRPIPLAHPISTGTLEQAYLSLRLAMVEHLDAGADRLPLFVDEALVNWDATRRDHGLDLLCTLSETRQVFAFTCHPEMARRMEARGARILRLER
jgi:uncharacterized protein YhaN